MGEYPCINCTAPTEAIAAPALCADCRAKGLALTSELTATSKRAARIVDDIAIEEFTSAWLSGHRQSNGHYRPSSHAALVDFDCADTPPITRVTISMAQRGWLVTTRQAFRDTMLAARAFHAERVICAKELLSRATAGTVLETLTPSEVNTYAASLPWINFIGVLESLERKCNAITLSAGPSRVTYAAAANAIASLRAAYVRNQSQLVALPHFVRAYGPLLDARRLTAAYDLFNALGSEE